MIFLLKKFLTVFNYSGVVIILESIIFKEFIEVGLFTTIF